jgi:propanediol dehydratase small subunit
VGLDASVDYPLGLRRPDLVATPGGVPLSELRLDAPGLDAADLRAAPATLRLQAELAAAAGRTQLAENLLRAAELAPLPDDLILEIYTALRPGRSSAQELEAWAARLDALEAPRSAAFVRDASAAYRERGLLG